MTLLPNDAPSADSDPAPVVAKPEAAQSRLIWMDQVRGVAIILVIILHAATVLGRFVTNMPPMLNSVLDFFAPFRMPILMFLSGMLLGRSIVKPAKIFFMGKLRGIGWPYLFWSAVFLLASEQLVIDKVLKVFYRPPTYLWYLWFLLAYYVIVWFVTRFRISPWLAVGVAFIGAFGPEMYRFSRFFFLFVFFLGGHLWMLNQHRLRLGPWALAVSGVVALATGVASFAGMNIRYEPLHILGTFSGVLFCLLLAPRLTNLPGAAALRYVGRNSIVFYVTHVVVLWLLFDLLTTLGVDNVWLLHPVGVAIAMSTGLVLTWCRHRFAWFGVLFEFPSELPRLRPARISSETPAA